MIEMMNISVKVGIQQQKSWFSQLATNLRGLRQSSTLYQDNELNSG